MKNSSVILLILGGFPILAYPFIFLAGIMSFAGERHEAPLLLTLVAYLFLSGSMAYPFIYLTCIFKAKKESNKYDGSSNRYARFPLIYIAGLTLVLAVWVILDIN